MAGAGFFEAFAGRYPDFVLETLLRDRTTGANIVWADDEYEALGCDYMADAEIAVERVCGLATGVIKPRIAKDLERQSRRTKSRAEVFTPSWLVNRMNNDVDEAWFGRRDAFNRECDGDGEGAGAGMGTCDAKARACGAGEANARGGGAVAEGSKTDAGGVRAWTATEGPVEFPEEEGRGWQDYVNATRLEIACGEAPFVCSRYDTVSGARIPVRERVGFLDRKLRVVSENTLTRAEWTKWALAALQASYGYEYQGDNLLLARINVFETFAEHLRKRWGVPAEKEELAQAARIVSWNFWQMDAFSCAAPVADAGGAAPARAQAALRQDPCAGPQPAPVQMSLFDMCEGREGDADGESPLPAGSGKTTRERAPLCVLYDWRHGERFEFAALERKASTMGKYFYAVIGNPPYQMESRGNNNSDTPIYHHFYSSAFEVGEKAELISPARFLFDAGGTPSEWNKQMLNDPHVKVMCYEPKSDTVFAGTDIKGGVAIVYRDSTVECGPVGTFTPFEELNSIVRKVAAHSSESLSSIITNRGLYRYSELAYKEQPEEMRKTADPRIAPSSFERMPALFTNTKPQDSHEYVQILGRDKDGRAYRWFRRDYIKAVTNLDKYKVIVPKANGSGALGEVLSTPLIGKPLIGFTETYISIGETDSAAEAEAILKYVKGKFSRVMLGVLKVTQNNAKPTWVKVPLQDFTSGSDIDWSQSIPDIDRQLYAKYGLDDAEIGFIETHVKEMS